MSTGEATPLPGVEVADLRDLKRWTTYFTRSKKSTASVEHAP
jgi:hypothetical protein